MTSEQFNGSYCSEDRSDVHLNPGASLETEEQLNLFLPDFDIIIGTLFFCPLVKGIQCHVNVGCFCY